MTRPTRRAILTLLLPAGAAGCSVVPDRPYQEVRRFALSPERPGQGAGQGAGAIPVGTRERPVLLVRSLRAAPGLEQRGLRILRADRTVEIRAWDEWAAPPAEAAEEALRRWLAGSGLFAAVTAPGSRLSADLVLEGELVRLRAEPAAGVARAGLSLLLLQARGEDGEGARIRGQILAEGEAPLPGARSEAPVAADRAAEAMVAALGNALARAEAEIRTLVAGTTRAG